MSLWNGGIKVPSAHAAGLCNDRALFRTAINEMICSSCDQRFRELLEVSESVSLKVTCSKKGYSKYQMLS